MCLILFSWKQSSHSLLMAANRDEFYQRPSQAVAYWDDYPNVIAGKDLKEGGTWLGVTKSGRFAAITNYRAPDKKIYPNSRGSLTKNFLTGHFSPRAYANAIQEEAQSYAGFNLLLGDLNELIYCSNKHPGYFSKKLNPGLYGLSNHLLDTPWPKVIKGKKGLESQIKKIDSYQENDNDALLQILSDKQKADTKELPNTGVGALFEKLLSPIFIASPTYGTRASTTLKIENKQVIFTEKQYLAGGVLGDQKVINFEIS